MGQPNKRLSEPHMRFYVAEILLALQYLHLLGFVYRCVSHIWTSVVEFSHSGYPTHTTCYIL